MAHGRWVVTTAPVDAEGGCLLTTRLGTIRLAWLIDDEATVEVVAESISVDATSGYVFGPSEVRDLCEQRFG